MTHQDYVSRTRNNKNKKNPYKKQQASEPSVNVTKLKFIALLAVIAIAAFGYFLWSIKDIEPETTNTVESPVKQPSEKSTELPKPPKEKWAYPQKLQEKEVDAGEYTVQERGPWKMQCGSFRTPQQAEKMKATIAFAGLASQISASNGSNGTWHKVSLGPYEKKRDAERDKHKLKSNGITTCQIWLWQ